MADQTDVPLTSVDASVGLDASARASWGTDAQQQQRVALVLPM